MEKSAYKASPKEEGVSAHRGYPKEQGKRGVTMGYFRFCYECRDK